MSSLSSPALEPVWAAVRERLERSGPDNRGRLRTPALSSQGTRLLSALLDRRAGATLDLAALEGALRRLGVGDDLPSALAALGWPVDLEQEERRRTSRRGAAARAAARAAADSWGDPAASVWVDAVVRAGLLAGADEDAAVRLVERTRDVLARVDVEADGPLSRVDLAAAVLGSSHALDPGTPEASAVTRALELRHAPARGRRAWEAAGVDFDLVSAPVLCWGLTSSGDLGPLLASARAASVPVHLSLLALRDHPVAVDAGTDILVVENPRIVEAACQQRLPGPVVALNGNPSTAAQLLVDQLRTSGAALRYHGDFDPAGLRICARMHRLGLVPWRMGATDYLDALARAEARGTPLPRDDRRSPPTPWDPELQAAFDRCRLVVHEELLLPGLLIA